MPSSKPLSLICTWDDSPGATPIGFLVHDPLFVCTALFTAYAFLDARHGRLCSLQTRHHPAGTSNGPGRPARGRRSDHRTMVTIVVVVTLGLAAEALEDD